MPYVVSPGGHGPHAKRWWARWELRDSPPHILWVVLRSIRGSAIFATRFHRNPRHRDPCLKKQATRQHTHSNDKTFETARQVWLSAYKLYLRQALRTSLTADELYERVIRLPCHHMAIAKGGRSGLGSHIGGQHPADLKRVS